MVVAVSALRKSDPLEQEVSELRAQLEWQGRRICPGPGRRAVADSATRPFDGFAQRKRQFAKPPFDPVHLDIRKVLTVYTRRALVRVMVKRIGGRVSINVKRAPLGGFTRGLEQVSSSTLDIGTESGVLQGS